MMVLYRRRNRRTSQLLCHQRLLRVPRFSLSAKIKGEKRGFFNLGIMHKILTMLALDTQ
jgi:hypothetical protein